MSLLGMLLAMIPCILYLFLTGRDLKEAQIMAMGPGMLISMLMMGVYLWKEGYISREKVSWSAVSPVYLLLTAVMTLPLIWVVDALTTPLHLPDWAGQAFEVLQTGWVGIFCMTLLGPVMEELIFRGGITKALLAEYEPTKAILISGIIFGVFHLNPAQAVPAALTGIILAWMYYRTASLVPCILVHILNNSVAVYLNLRYPEVKTMHEWVGNNATYLILTGIAAVIVLVTVLLMNRTRVRYSWKEDII